MPFSTVFWLFFPLALIVILSVITLFTEKGRGDRYQKGVEQSAD